MTTLVHHHGRGAALLFVLGTLVLVTGALTLVTLSAAQGHRAIRTAEDERVAADLLAAAEPLVLNWLAKESQRTAIHPDAPEPRVQILSLAWEDAGASRTHTRSLRVAAWDLSGMLPAWTSSASPLWLAVRPEWRGLPLKEATTLLDLVGGERCAVVGPVHPMTDSDTGALGALIALVPLDSARSLAEPASPTININTAPRPLLEAALRLAQRGDLASIVEARSEGRVAPAPLTPRASERGQALAQLTERSTLWAVRVDAHADGLIRSWWTVYASRRGRWDILERHAIHE
jgi:hypothetical protein